MKKPTPLTELLEDLNANPPSSSIAANLRLPKEAYAVVYMTTDDYENEDGIRLNSEECAVLLGTPDTVDMLLDALGNPEDASIIVHLLDLPTGALDAIERRFASVDEA